MDHTLKVTKRNGRREPFIPEKINAILDWACEDLNASSMDIAMHARLGLYDGVPTTSIHQQLIESAAALISVESPDYQYATGRLVVAGIRKEVWGSTVPPDFGYFIQSNRDLGLYADWIMDEFSPEEIQFLGSKIDHDRDFQFTGAGIQQMRDKYLIQDRVDRRLYETPQFAYMLMAMGLYRRAPNRMEYIVDAYNAYTQPPQINLPTPVLSGMRSRIDSCASCALLQVGDTLPSIMHTLTAAAKAISTRYGLGIDMSRIRAAGSSIRGGESVHSGVVPFLKMYEATVRGIYQGGVRRGSATVFFPWWHYEIEGILCLKDVTGSEVQIVRNLDYGIGFEKVILSRALAKRTVTLFSPHEVPELIASMGSPEFESLYEAAERNPAIQMKKVVGADDLVRLFVGKRFETTRYYVLFLDNANRHSPWKEQVTMSNLCLSGSVRLRTASGMLRMRDLWESHGRPNIGGEILDAPAAMEFVVNRTGLAASSPVTRTAMSAPIYEMELTCGIRLRATLHHEIDLEDGSRRRLGELVPGDSVLLHPGEAFGEDDRTDLATLAGVVIGDGSLATTDVESGRQRALIRLWGSDIEDIGPILSPMLQDLYRANRHAGAGKDDPTFAFVGKECHGNVPRAVVGSSVLGRLMWDEGVKVKDKHRVPEFVWSGTRATVGAFLRGLYSADGTAGAYGASCMVSLTQSDREFLGEVQQLLLMLGITSRIHKSSDDKVLPRSDGKGGIALYPHRATWRLCATGRDNLVRFCESVGFLQPRKNASLSGWLATHPGSNNSRTRYASEVTSITYVGEEETFCLNEPARHEIVVEGVVTGQCMEITQPTVAIQKPDDPDAEAGVCILSAVNVVNTPISALPRVCELIVRALDGLIDTQDYFDIAARNFATRRRSLGVGIMNFAAYIASLGMDYDHPEAPNVAARYMEAVEYWLLVASCKMAQELGPCEYYSRTKWAEGILPIDTYRKSIDEFVTEPLHQDWEGLRALIAQHGLRHSTLTATMPSESSSVLHNATNSIEPPKSRIIAKGSGAGHASMLLPGDPASYTLAYEYPSNMGLMRVVAALQKFTDMSISVNKYYQPGRYPNRVVPQDLLLREFYAAWNMGLKTLYYIVPDDGDQQTASGDAPAEGAGCASGACSL